MMTSYGASSESMSLPIPDSSSSFHIWTPSSFVNGSRHLKIMAFRHFFIRAPCFQFSTVWCLRRERNGETQQQLGNFEPCSLHCTPWEVIINFPYGRAWMVRRLSNFSTRLVMKQNDLNFQYSFKYSLKLKLQIKQLTKPLSALNSGDSKSQAPPEHCKPL